MPDRPMTSRTHHRGAAGDWPGQPTSGARPASLTPTPAPELERLRAELEAAQAQTSEHLASLQRTAADFANFRRRTAEDRERDLGLASESPAAQAAGRGRRLRSGPGGHAGRAPWSRLDRGHRSARSQAAPAARERRCHPDRGDRPALRPPRARSDRQRPRPGAARRGGRGRSPARLPSSRPSSATGEGRGRRRRRGRHRATPIHTTTDTDRSNEERNTDGQDHRHRPGTTNSVVE